MKILLKPLIPLNKNDRIRYEIDGDVIKATLNGITDTFDFTGAPNGVLELYDTETKTEVIDTPLDINPIRAAEKKDGELYVTLRHYISRDATEAERFPDWIDAEDYTPPEIPKEEEEENSDATEG